MSCESADAVLPENKVGAVWKLWNVWQAQGQCCVWRQLGRIAGFSGTPRQTGGRYCWSSSFSSHRIYTVTRRMQYGKTVLRIAFITAEQNPICESKCLSPSFDGSSFSCWREDTAADALVLGPVLRDAPWQSVGIDGDTVLSLSHWNIKGTVHSRMKILSSFSLHHIVPTVFCETKQNKTCIINPYNKKSLGAKKTLKHWTLQNFIVW